MGHKRSCCCTAGIGYQHRSLHFHKVLGCQELTDLPDDPGTLHKYIAGIQIHCQIHITLTIAGIRISQTVELLRQDLQGFGQQRHLGRMNRDLTGHGAEHIAFHTVDITDIALLKVRICIIAQRILGNIHLNIAVAVSEIGKGSLTHHALKHHTACYRHVDRRCIQHGASRFISRLLRCAVSRDRIIVGAFCRLRQYFQFHIILQDLFFMCLIKTDRFIGMMRLIVLCDHKRILACFLQGRQFLTAHLPKLVYILLLRFVLFVLYLFSHGSSPVYYFNL